MFKIDIKKELDQKRDTTIKQADDVTKDIKLLMDTNNAKENQILKATGLGYAIKQGETQHGLNLERKTFEEQFEGKVFTESEIKTLSLKYDLKFLKSRKYKGATDLRLGSILVRFFEKNEFRFDEHSDHTDRLYIMAPAKAFNLNPREKEPIPRQVDPVIFYKVPTRSRGGYEEEDKYVFIHHWGNDFTIMRVLRGLVRETARTAYWFNYALSFSIIFTLMAGITGMADTGYSALGTIIMMTLSGLLSFGATALWMYGSRGEEKWSRLEGYYNNKSWNEDYH